MATRSHDPQKAPQNSTFVPVNNQFQPRPFPVQEKPQTHETPDLQAQLESAQRFGHNFANISISAPNSSTPPPIQPKLTIGEPGDKYEQEADKTAAEVVQRLHAPMPSYGRDLSQPESQLAQTIKAGMVQNSNSIHQQGIPNHQNKLMRMLDVPTLQREVMPEEEPEKELQMKPMIQRQSSEDGTASPDLEATIQQARGSGQSLAQSILKPMEQAFGADFSGVKIHTDAQSNQLNRSIQAKAFTTGQDIFFREGAYEPGSRGGQELIAHELTHVVQQNGSAVQRSLQPQQKSVIQRQGDQSPAQSTAGFSGDVAGDLDKLYKQAEEAQPELYEKVTQIASETSGVAKLPQALKGRERAMEKTMADYKGDVSKLVDIARGSIVYKSFPDLMGGLDVCNRNLTLVREKNRFAQPTPAGYRDILLNVQLSNGHIAELQLHLTQILEVKSGAGHKIYEEVRKIEAAAQTADRALSSEEKAKIEQLNAEAKALYDQALANAGG
ncbi:DUF4157 domain-containing protein [Coleofasciculus sp. FACHB-129]|uniref:eCIS core domain-containing protein n=1 Tax=Cyanophyceae TaxID=3028117 RepID=UPI0016856CB8|nr:DUF4157 domain-containing protein [Coleofasciculus sp. FACHB-129]MBD1894181.1 DUF4157 domain-containing protein [Coleofasciculus sp. FACHB-129]